MIQPIRLTWLQSAALFVAVLTAVRLLVSGLSSLNLGPDEAQYWVWSTDPAFGYFSKPPMLAWVIGLTTAVCGEEEACIRAGSPLFHAGTGMVLFFLGRALFDERVGFWSAVTFVTLPGVWLSAIIASTDVPLLFFWSLGLLTSWKAMHAEEGRTAWTWTIAAGTAIGLGFLSKYAMLYFLAGLILFAMLDPAARRWLASPRGAIAALIAAAILAPNVLWNLSNDFATVSHTAANANWQGSLFNPEEMIKFIGDQFAVFGPVLFAALLWGLVTLPSRLSDDETRRAVTFLLVFTLPPLLVVTVQAFISRANANWAATAYVAGTVLVAAWLSRVRWQALLPSSLALHCVLGALFYASVLSMPLAEVLGGANAFKRVRAWDEIGAAVVRMADEDPGDAPITAVLVNDRLVYGELTYYARPLPVPLTMWDANQVPENHFELTAPLTEQLGRRVLFVTRSKRTAYVLRHFEKATLLDTVTSDIGGGRKRTFKIFLAEGYKRQAADEQ